MNEKYNVENLKHFEKGQSGNPNGRPKGKSFKKIIKQYLKEETKFEDGHWSATEEGEKEFVVTETFHLTRKEKMILIAIREASNEHADPKSRLDHLKFLIERIDGKVTDKLDHTSGGKPMAQDKPTILVNFQPRNDEPAE